MIRFLNAQSIATVEIHSQLYQVFGHTRLDGQNISSRSSAVWAGVFNHHPPYNPDLAPNDFHLFLHLKKFLTGQRKRFHNDREAEVSVTVVPIPGSRVLRHRIQKLVSRYTKCHNSRSEYVEVAQHLLYLLQ